MSHAAAFLLAREGGAIAGGVGLWPLDEHVCEMKRLFVHPDWRRKGLGRRLAITIIEEARQRSYQPTRLDTLPQLVEALVLYRNLGFVDTDHYYDNPLDGDSYLELDLSKE